MYWQVSSSKWNMVPIWGLLIFHILLKEIISASYELCVHVRVCIHVCVCANYSLYKIRSTDITKCWSLMNCFLNSAIEYFYSETCHLRPLQWKTTLRVDTTSAEHLVVFHYHFHLPFKTICHLRPHFCEP